MVLAENHLLSPFLHISCYSPVSSRTLQKSYLGVHDLSNTSKNEDSLIQSLQEEVEGREEMCLDTWKGAAKGTGISRD